MSLLRVCRSRPSCLRSRASPIAIAWMSSLPGSHIPADSNPTPVSASSSPAGQPSTSTGQTDSPYFDVLATQKSQTTDSHPPVGTAYPPPQSDKNPVRSKVADTRENQRYSLYVQSTRNNTIATFTRPNGNPIVTVSGGKCGFKGVRKSSYEAGYQCATTIFKKITELKEEASDSMSLQVLFKGFGQGRDAMYRALMSDEGIEVRKLVSRVTDITPIKIGGTRAKKARRI